MQKKAWDHHHKFECFILGSFHGLLKKDGDVVDVALTKQSWDFRCLLRLLVPHANSQFLADEWNEICSLQSRLVMNEKSPRTIEQGRIVARVPKLATGSALNVEEILKLLFAVSFPHWTFDLMLIDCYVVP